MELRPAGYESVYLAVRRYFRIGLYLLFLVGSSWQASAQPATPLTLQAIQKPIKEVFREIEQQTGYTIEYQSNVLDLTRKVTIKATHERLTVILDQLLSETGTTYTLQGRSILIISRESASSASPPSLSSGSASGFPVTGLVTDPSGKPLPGVTINIKGTLINAITDSSGHFSIHMPDDKTVLVFTHIGYERKEIRIGTQRYLRVNLAPSGKQLEEVIVAARMRLNTENALLNERKRMAVISDGISAKNMEKTASLTTTQALQRVTGVTITDDKYVAIRGLGDRGVIAELNGIRLSSSDPDRTAVPLDLVPAGLLDNITVFKTFTPDRPADGSAGIVELKTKSVPDSMTLSIAVQLGTNSTIGINGKWNGFRNADPGFWGQGVNNHNLSQDFENLSRQYPGGRQQIQQLFIDSRLSPSLTAEANRINNIMLGFDPVITTSYQKARPNQVYGITFGNDFKVFKGHDLGLILSGNYYHRTEDRYQGELNQWSIYQGVVTGTGIYGPGPSGPVLLSGVDIYSPLHIPAFITPDNVSLGKYISYKENTGTEKLNYGGLAGLTYKFNANNEISGQYIFSRGAEVSGTNLTGAYQNTGLVATVYNTLYGLKQSYRIFNTFNLQGEHKVGKGALATRISWNAATSRSFQNEPDYRFVNLVDKYDLRYLDQNGIGIGSHTYGLVVGTVHGVGPLDYIFADPNGRRFRHLNEDNRNGKVDISQPFQLFGQIQTLKAGVNYLRRVRNYSENVLGLPSDLSILQSSNGDPNALVSYKNIGLRDPGGYNDEGQPRVGGFIYEIRKSPNNYTGHYETRAVYGMLDLHLSDRWRLAGGVRFESTDILAVVDTNNVYKDPRLVAIPGIKYAPINPVIGYKTDLTPYYSANLVYRYGNNVNFRAAYSTTLARPELRELTNIYEFDPFQFAVVTGNPSLHNQLTKSLDFRWEWFPAPGEVLSASVFGKRIEQQLTKVFSMNSPGTEATNPEYPIIRFVNDPEPGTVYGIELEARKNLAVLGRPWQHLFVGTNALLAASEIKKNPERLRAARIIDRHSPETSPLFEQAPYSVNAYLDYDNPRSRTNITASFNIVGERLVQVQLDGAPDLYDRPVPVLDLVFSQRFGSRWLVKGFAKNILNPPYRVVYARPGTNGQYYGKTYIQHQFYKGVEYSLGVIYDLF